MKKIKIAIQGEPGAYSHIAANNLFKNAEIKTCATFEETFKQAYEDDSYKIIIPIENSLAGRVADIHYLLPKYKLQIYGEYFLIATPMLSWRLRIPAFCTPTHILLGVKWRPFNSWGVSSFRQNGGTSPPLGALSP